MALGECNCGAVAFEITAPVTDVYICHCSICRRATGSNGIAVILVGSSEFRWLRGSGLISSWTKPDADWHLSFCRTCGSPLPGENDEARLFVPAGLLSDGGDLLTVKHHVWVDSKADWDEIGDSGRQHSEALRD